MSMDQEVKAAIEKNLPSAVGDVLKKRLEQAERDAQERDSYKGKCARLEAQVQRTEGERTTWREKALAYEGREDALVKREKEIQKLELTAQFEREKTTLVQTMFNTVFQNRIVRENALVTRETVTRNEYGSGGSSVTESRCPVSVEEKKTLEEG